jgi:hypothetical protein
METSFIWVQEIPPGSGKCVGFGEINRITLNKRVDYIV